MKIAVFMFAIKYAVMGFDVYRQIFDMIRTKSYNLKVSHLVLQLSLGNMLKSGVESRMKT